MYHVSMFNVCIVYTYGRIFHVCAARKVMCSIDSYEYVHHVRADRGHMCTHAFDVCHQNIGPSMQTKHSYKPGIKNNFPYMNAACTLAAMCIFGIGIRICTQLHTRSYIQPSVKKKL